MTQALKETLRHPSLYLPTPARIASILPLTSTEKLFTLELPQGISLQHKPGQFVEVSLPGIGEAPFSISSSPSRSNGRLELCIRRTGRLTSALHSLRPGDYVGLRGPFGRGFPLEQFRGKDLLFAPGGLGLAPLRSAINEVLDHRGQFQRVIILYGARDPGELLFKEELEQWRVRDDIELHLTVDRADEDWKGHVGVITTLFPEIQISPRTAIAMVCGPPVMYHFVIMELQAKGFPEGNIWLSLERRMKCGTGKCGHCQMNHIYTCIDGPVFSYDQIKSLEEAL